MIRKDIKSKNVGSGLILDNNPQMINMAPVSSGSSCLRLGRWNQGTMPPTPQDFARYVNPISIRGADYAHQITARPSPGFLDLPTGLTLTYCLMMRGGRIYETAHTAVLKQKPVSLARNQPKKQKFT